MHDRASLTMTIEDTYDVALHGDLKITVVYDRSLVSVVDTVAGTSVVLPLAQYGLVRPMLVHAYRANAPADLVLIARALQDVSRDADARALPVLADVLRAAGEAGALPETYEAVARLLSGRARKLADPSSRSRSEATTSEAPVLELPRPQPTRRKPAAPSEPVPVLAAAPLAEQAPPAEEDRPAGRVVDERQGFRVEEEADGGYLLRDADGRIFARAEPLSGGMLKLYSPDNLFRSSLHPNRRHAAYRAEKESLAAIRS